MAIGAILGQTMNPGDGIDLIGRDISIKLSEQEGNGLKFDETGALLGGAGKRTCRFVVGTSTAGWTQEDCDYLCDGTDDQVEINAAIQALPSGGGEIVILDGTYNITATIAMDKDNVKLSGNGNATVLKRMWNNSVYYEGVITITTINGGCRIENLFIDGNKTNYSSSDNNGIRVHENSNNNIIIHNICDDNYKSISISSNNNIIVNNICLNNQYGIYLFGYDNIIANNNCNNNYEGMYISGNGSNLIANNICSYNDSGFSVVSSNSTVIGNICRKNNGNGILMSATNATVIGNICNDNTQTGIYSSSSVNSTISGNTCNNNNIGIRASSYSAITGNTCYNNKLDGIILESNKCCTVTGNICIRGKGTSSDYSSSQYTIRLAGDNNDYNLISSNNIMGKNYVSEGGTGNTFVNNKYN